MSYPFLLYGSYGYTGGLIADLAVQRGLRPLLAGRDAEKLRQQADRLGLEYRVFPLDDQTALDAALNEAELVLHIAGPYHRTSHLVAEACLRTHRHYLDITGELVVFEYLAGLDEAAKNAGIVLLPGAGFDVVPSDCLALYLKQRLPTATRLALAVRSLGSGVSQGTALTVVESMTHGGAMREQGQLVKIPYAARIRRVDFGRGPRTVALMPLGDLTTAYHSTGIANIETYTYLPPTQLRLVRTLRWFTGVADRPWLQRLLRRVIKAQPPGPSAEARQSGKCLVWAEVTDEHGQRLAARLETPEAYQLTAHTALCAAEKILAGTLQPGFQTPARLFGADFILEFDGVARYGPD